MCLIVASGAQTPFGLRQGLRRQHVGLLVSVCTAPDAALIGSGVAGIATALGRQRGLLDAVALAGGAVLSLYGAQAARRALGAQALAAAAGGAAQTRVAPAVQSGLGQVQATAAAYRGRSWLHGGDPVKHPG
ncbi:MAG: LysE family transporter [Betaproteobacteria bacterium]